MSCYRQTCTQTITGRYLEYWRALKVIQNEEYLMVTDLDIIQRLQKGGEGFKSKLILFSEDLNGAKLGFFAIFCLTPLCKSF